jgi:hypothetical protein
MAATALKAELSSSRSDTGLTIRGGLKSMGSLDRAAAEVNPFLTIIAIGLAAVTLTTFAALAIEDALPSITRVSCGEFTTAAPAAPSSVTTAASRRQVTGVAVDDAMSDRPIRNL